ncbi:hypothetical protein ACWCXL_12165 [Streptomyces sp. NPDC001588]
MSSTVQNPPVPSSERETHSDAIGRALLAIESLFKAGAALADAEDKSPAEICRGDLALVEMWLPELYDRLTNPARMLDDLAASHDLEIRTTAAPGAEDLLVIAGEGVVIVPADMPAETALTELRAALAQDNPK